MLTGVEEGRLSKLGELVVFANALRQSVEQAAKIAESKIVGECLGTDLAGTLAALDVVDDFWAPTLERLRRLPEEVRYTRVNDEWSTVETLRHLVSVYDGWFGRAVLGEADAYHPLGLTATFLDPADYGIDPDLRPSLDEVLAARSERQQQVREHLRTLDDAALTRPIPTHGIDGGFPPDEERSTLDCLTVIFDEEWAHHGFAVRDLDVLDPPGSGAGPAT